MPPRRLSAAQKAAIIRQGFDTVAATQAVQDYETLNAVVDQSFSRLGYDVYAGITQASAGGEPHVSVLFGANHEAWGAHYFAQNHQRRDACITVSLKQSDPFYWSEVPSLTVVSDAEQRVFDEAATFKLNDGMLVPMHGIDGSISSVLLAGERIDARDPKLRATSHMLALYFGAAGRRIAGQTERRPFVPLTARQVECLRWVREGKSSSDIGEILGLSPRTVDFYIGNACQRLGVRTRAQAVAEAALRGVIQL